MENGTLERGMEKCYNPARNGASGAGCKDRKEIDMAIYPLPVQHLRHIFSLLLIGSVIAIKLKFFV